MMRQRELAGSDGHVIATRLSTGAWVLLAYLVGTAAMLWIRHH